MATAGPGVGMFTVVAHTSAVHSHVCFPLTSGNFCPPVSSGVSVREEQPLGPGEGAVPALCARPVRKREAWLCLGFLTLGEKVLKLSPGPPGGRRREFTPHVGVPSALTENAVPCSVQAAQGKTIGAVSVRDPPAPC